MALTSWWTISRMTIAIARSWWLRSSYWIDFFYQNVNKTKKLKQTWNNLNKSVRYGENKSLIVKCFTWISTAISNIHISNRKCTSNKTWISWINTLTHCATAIIWTIIANKSPVETPVDIGCWWTTSNTLNCQCLTNMDLNLTLRNGDNRWFSYSEFQSKYFIENTF